MENKIFFPPEWYPQDGVMLTWPHSATDWFPDLQEVTLAYLELAREIIKQEKVVITARDIDDVRSLFSGDEQARIIFSGTASNDTWARDHGPVSIFRNGRPVICDFQFNGWGNKFNAELDNGITSRLFGQQVFLPEVIMESHPGFVLEGGSIETDGKGTILTTSECLLNPNRNPDSNKTDIEEYLKSHLGADRILWLDHGALSGDDTDSHIDTLARFCNENTICYVQCRDESDIHYEELQKMERQLQGFTTFDGRPYNLVPLPLPDPCTDESGKRLPATYANFLIINGAVLVPVYGQEKDQDALEILGRIFPDRQIIGINCLPFIKQNGSLHCITMQIPKGFLR